MVARLRQLGDGLGGVVDLAGRCASWLCLPLIVLLFLQLPLREIVHGGNNAANDVGQIIFANFMMVGIPYAMRWDAHVRVDIVHRHFGRRLRAFVELVGTEGLQSHVLGSQESQIGGGLGFRSRMRMCSAIGVKLFHANDKPGRPGLSCTTMSKRHLG